ncbi:hypothetical protein B566_EDAN003756, partial [Ephemera danica]
MSVALRLDKASYHVTENVCELCRYDKASAGPQASMTRHRLVLGAFFILAGLCCIANADYKKVPKVTIKQGTLRGKVIKAASNREIYTFLGIPYAKPPQRFKLAEAAEPWKGEWDATNNRSICTQEKLPSLHFVGEEDCLFANVYTTNKLPRDIEGELAPVVVYIHGGIFQHMSGDFENYDPTYLLNDYQPIVLLLQWIRDNIAAFGGDAKRVTLMGDNAGAISAHWHMLSPLSKGLFHGVISQCGTALTHWAMSRDPRGRFHRLAELVDCGDNTTSSRDIIKCMEDLDARKIVRSSQAVLKWRTDWISPFLPSVESQDWSNGGAFLPDYPRNLMYDKKFYPVPWLTGVTSQAGTPHTLQLMLFSNMRNDLNKEFEHYAPYYFELDGELEDAKKAAKKIRSFYFKGHPITQGSQTELSEMHTDYYYFVPLIQSAAYHVTAGAPPVYIYHFSYQFRKSPLAKGVPQGDDTQYVVPKADMDYALPKSNDEIKIANRLRKAIRNFIRNGKPIEDGD